MLQPRNVFLSFTVFCSFLLLFANNPENLTSLILNSRTLERQKRFTHSSYTRDWKNVSVWRLRWPEVGEGVNYVHLKITSSASQKGKKYCVRNKNRVYSWNKTGIKGFKSPSSLNLLSGFFKLAESGLALVWFSFIFVCLTFFCITCTEQKCHTSLYPQKNKISQLSYVAFEHLIFPNVGGKKKKFLAKAEGGIANVKISVRGAFVPVV